MYIDKLFVEVIIHKKDGNDDIIKKYYDSLFLKYIVFENDLRISMRVGIDDHWFKNGTVNNLIREFGNKIYFALAYYAQSDEIITDFDGNEIQSFDSVIDGRSYKKYVKKSMIITRIINKDNQSFEVKAYLFDYKSIPPVIEVMSFYAIGSLIDVKSAFDGIVNNAKQEK